MYSQNALQVQRAFRSHRMRLTFSVTKKSWEVGATVIQRALRVRQARVRYKRYTGARRIQAIVRMEQARVRYKRYTGARRIQAIVRMEQARVRYKQYTFVRRIQAFVRMGQARVRYKQYKSAKRIQSFVRMEQARVRYAQYTSAKRIQSFVRMSQVKLRYVQFTSARRIQCVYRSFKSHEIVLMIYLKGYLASEIQKVWRGKSVRNEKRRKNEAATKVRKEEGRTVLLAGCSNLAHSLIAFHSPPPDRADSGGVQEVHRVLVVQNQDPRGTEHYKGCKGILSEREEVREVGNREGMSNRKSARVCEATNSKTISAKPHTLSALPTGGV